MSLLRSRREARRDSTLPLAPLLLDSHPRLGPDPLQGGYMREGHGGCSQCQAFPCALSSPGVLVGTLPEHGLHICLHLEFWAWTRYLFPVMNLGQPLRVPSTTSCWILSWGLLEPQGFTNRQSGATNRMLQKLSRLLEGTETAHLLRASAGNAWRHPKSPRRTRLLDKASCSHGGQLAASSRKP